MTTFFLGIVRHLSGSSRIISIKWVRDGVENSVTTMRPRISRWSWKTNKSVYTIGPRSLKIFYFRAMAEQPALGAWLFFGRARKQLSRYELACSSKLRAGDARHVAPETNVHLLSAIVPLFRLLFASSTPPLVLLSRLLCNCTIGHEKLIIWSRWYCCTAMER